MGLDNHHFGTMRSQILNSESMTDIDLIYAQAVREKRQSTIIASLEAKPFEVATFHASGSRYVRDPNKPSCSHCGKPGYDKASYWEIIGYPTDHQWRRSSRGNKGRHGSISRSAMANSAQLNLISPTSNVGKAKEEFQQQRGGTSDSATIGSLVPPYFSDAIITDKTPHVEPRERMNTSRVERTQHTPEMNEPRCEVALEINTMTHGETEAMTSDGVVDHELEIAPHGEHGVTNEKEEKEDELQEQVVMDARPK
ncbi:hypothetical protein GH714_037351 [Hevea brasiliensis]|uniref:CCHC-type domain-containing protein n=1 Tax=Hevea brasiliensis TaxID=3981 RepID=A0A6A6KQ83_HEVBR|nr:hypothetical protein GH714_037351 [Hevea brasiliensis]